MFSLPHPNRRLRVIGFDDAPFDKSVANAPVSLAGVVCSRTRFEGMLWGSVTRDGFDATDVMVSMLRASKYLAQIHVVLIDGISIGGLNLVDLQTLASEVEKTVHCRDAAHA